MNRPNSILLVICFFLPAFYGHAQLNPVTASVIVDFGEEIRSDVAADQVHGSISIAIMKNDRVIWSNAYGYANADKDIAADPTTIYRAGSITKSFTAILLMQLVEEKKIALDDAVDRYLPELKQLNGYEKAGPISFRQLASHTSGIKREPDMESASVGLVENWEEKVLACIPNTSFTSLPGKKFLYSNIGYAILGLAIGRIAGIPYLQLIQQRIFGPLHMAHTFFIAEGAQFAHLAQGIDNSNAHSLNTATPLRELKGRGYRVPNGGIFSTPEDLCKLAAALTGKTRLVSSASLKEMQSIPPGGDKYGLGLIITKNKFADIIGHNGSVSGYTAQYAVDQESGYAVVLMRNYNLGRTNLDLAAIELLGRLKRSE